MRGSKLFLSAAYQQGIRKAFGIVGGEAKAMRFDEVEGLDFYLTRHEFAAGMMCDVYARQTGRPQILYSTFGPGLTNMSTGVCSAILDRSPMLAVSAQIPRSETVHNWTHQCLDNVALMKPMTKFAHEFQSVEEIPAIVREALFHARSGVPGPSFLSFPVDLMEEDIDDAVALRLLEEMGSSDPEPFADAPRDELQWLAEQIRNAKNPIAIAGNPIIREDACAELTRFLETWQIPLITTLASKGLIPETHPLHIGPVNKYLDGILKHPVLDDIFGDCDLMLLIGYDFGEDLKPSQWMRTDKIRNLSLASTPNPMGKVFSPEREVLGSLKSALPVLTEMAGTVERKPDLAKIASLRERKVNAAQTGPQSGESISVEAVVRSVREAVGEEGILCSDIGLHKQYAGLFTPTYEPNTFMCSNGTGSFGFGLPAAMGAKLAHPDKRVGLICGDGGFHSTSQDLETAIRYGLPMTIVLLKDSAFGLIKYYQLLDKDTPFGGSVEFGDVDFVKLAEANGWKGCVVTSIEELRQAANGAFESDENLLIEIPMKYQYRFAAPTG